MTETLRIPGAIAIALTYMRERAKIETAPVCRRSDLDSVERETGEVPWPVVAAYAAGVANHVNPGGSHVSAIAEFTAAARDDGLHHSYVAFDYDNGYYWICRGGRVLSEFSCWRMGDFVPASKEDYPEPFFAYLVMLGLDVDAFYEVDAIPDEIHIEIV